MSKSKPMPARPHSEGMGTRATIGTSVLMFQVAMIIYARFIPSRYFCWAPLDTDSDFAITVFVHNRALSGQEVRQRYRIPERGHEGRSIQHVKDIISQYEQTYGRADGAQVTLTYRINGVNPQRWIWPPP